MIFTRSVLPIRTSNCVVAFAPRSMRSIHRSFSATPQPKDDTTKKEHNHVFIYPKAQDLFARITSEMTADDVRLLADTLNSTLGRPIRKNEFYYKSLGRVKAAAASTGATALVEGTQVPVQEEKSTVDIRLTGFAAASKIKVIKEVRAFAGLGLKEAKELVEGAPTTIQKGIKLEEAQELKKRLEEVGAEIEFV